MTDLVQNGHTTPASETSVFQLTDDVINQVVGKLSELTGVEWKMKIQPEQKTHEGRTIPSRKLIETGHQINPNRFSEFLQPSIEQYQLITSLLTITRERTTVSLYEGDRTDKLVKVGERPATERDKQILGPEVVKWAGAYNPTGSLGFPASDISQEFIAKLNDPEIGQQLKKTFMPFKLLLERLASQDPERNLIPKASFRA